MKHNRRLKYALVLAGGGARGLVHIGVLCALEAAGYPPPSLIAGTSMGAIVGGLYAAGVSLTELRRFVIEELDISNFMENPGFKLNGPLGKLLVTGQSIRHFVTRRGIDTGDKAFALIEKFTEGRNFEDCRIPFICNAVDLVSGREALFNSGSLARAIRSSMSFPVFFEPYLEGGACFVDGGIINNMPVGAARKAGKALGIHRILAVDTHSKWRDIPAREYRNGLSVMTRCFDVMMHTLETHQRGADLTLYAADTSGVAAFERKKELIALGEAAVAQSGRELGAFFGSGPAAYFERKKHTSCGIRLEGKFA